MYQPEEFYIVNNSMGQAYANLERIKAFVLGLDSASIRIKVDVDADVNLGDYSSFAEGYIAGGDRARLEGIRSV